MLMSTETSFQSNMYVYACINAHIYSKEYIYSFEANMDDLIKKEFQATKYNSKTNRIYVIYINTKKPNAIINYKQQN